MKKLVIILCIFFVACKGEEEKPDYVWEEQRFEDVLVAMQKAEGIVRLGYNKKGDTLYAADSVYAAVLRQQNATQAQFDSNYNYYLNHPKKFEKIYDKVIVRLSEASAVLQKKRKTPVDTVDSSLTDTLN